MLFIFRQFLHLIVPFLYASPGGTYHQASLVEPIPMVRPKEPDTSPKRTKKVRLGIYRTQIQPSDHDIVAISGQ